MAVAASPMATHAVDITSTFERAVESLLCHRAYLEGLGQTEEDARRFLREYAEACGRRFGGVLATVTFGAPLGPFFATLLTNASTVDLWGSVVKTTLFGAIIAIVCSYKGMTASGGAEGVGRSVNQAVVIAFLGVFAFNYVFTQTLLATHPELSVIK